MNRPFDNALDGAGGLAGCGDLGRAAVVGGLSGGVGGIQALGQGGGVVLGFVQLGFQPVDAPGLDPGKDDRETEGGEKGADHLAHATA